MELRDKKVAVLGLGVENQSLTHFLIKSGAIVTVCDINKKLKKTRGIKNWRPGSCYLKNLTDFDIVFRTPGLPLSTPEIVKAKKKGVIISSATKLFFDLCPAKILGVTGTKGKGTCASLIKEMLIKSQKSKIFLGGNIGTPAFSFLEKIKPQDLVVLELSSFQLEDLEKSPHIAVVLNVTSDHLDYHKSKSGYIKAKENIVFYQKKSDFAVINMDYLTSYKFAAQTQGKVFWFSTKKSIDHGCFINRNEEIILRIENKDYLICHQNDIKLLGAHNLENVCAAVIASYLAGANIKNIRKIIKRFKGLEHRLEIVARKNNITYINDSYSTTPETTIAAIKALGIDIKKANKIILICGGKSKGGDYTKLADVILKSSIKSVILIGEMAQKIERKIRNPKFEIRNKSKFPKFKVKNLGFAKMTEIVKTAQKESEPGDVVLFSPGCASFDMFKNASDRGRQFKEIVKVLSKK